MSPLSELKLQNDHSLIIYHAEITRNRNLAIEISEKSLKAALEEAETASNISLEKVKPIIDKLEQNLRYFRRIADEEFTYVE